MHCSHCEMTIRNTLLNITYDLALEFFASCSFYHLEKKEQEETLFYNLLLRSTFVFFRPEEIENIRQINYFLQDVLNTKDTPYFKMLLNLCNANATDRLVPIQIKLKK